MAAANTFGSSADAAKCRVENFGSLSATSTGDEGCLDAAPSRLVRMDHETIAWADKGSIRVVKNGTRTSTEAAFGTISSLEKIGQGQVLAVTAESRLGIFSTAEMEWVDAPCFFPEDEIKGAYLGTSGDVKPRLVVVLQSKLPRSAITHRVVEVDMSSCQITWQLPKGILQPNDQVRHMENAGQNRWAIFLADGAVLFFDARKQAGLAFTEDVLARKDGVAPLGRIRKVQTLTAHSSSGKGSLDGYFILLDNEEGGNSTLKYVSLSQAAGASLAIEHVAKDSNELSLYLISWLETTPRWLVGLVMFVLVFYWNLKKVHRKRESRQEDPNELAERIRKLRESGRVKFKNEDSPAANTAE
ncbi:unnamed protein product [Amoebophrya sp. A25]|nr:unnamed protein product [Amoebophrya sp. A25]|eukprot:GSA25T00012569001.1